MAVLVLLLNVVLAFLFISIVNNAGGGPGSGGPASSGPSAAETLSPEERQAAAKLAEETIRKALRAANAAASASPSNDS